MYIVTVVNIYFKKSFVNNSRSYELFIFDIYLPTEQNINIKIKVKR